MKSHVKTVEVENLNVDKNNWAMMMVRQKEQGGNSQNFSRKFVRFIVTLGLKILRL
jgi:hypothetical protein